MLYNTIKQFIALGRIQGLAEKVDIFYAAGKLSGEQYAELTAALEQAGD